MSKALAALRKHWRLTVLAVAILATALIYWPRAESNVAVPSLIRVDFGYMREPLRRTSTFNLCAFNTREFYPECSRPGAALPDQTLDPSATPSLASSPAASTPADPSAPSTASPAPSNGSSAPESNPSDPSVTARPAITSTGLTGDLILVRLPDGDTVDQESPCPRGGKAFPAQQIAVTAESFDTQGITVSLIADPTEPEIVPPGTYCGSVLITRAPADPVVIQVPIAIDLSDRLSGWIILKVAASLMIGAAIGALLKWIADNVKPGNLDQLGTDFQPRTLDLSFVRENPGFVLGAATALAVAVAGIASQFVPDATFNNDFLDYFTLGLWAFTGQLAGQTIIDAAGAVKTSRAGADQADQADQEQQTSGREQEDVVQPVVEEDAEQAGEQEPEQEQEDVVQPVVEEGAEQAGRDQEPAVQEHADQEDDLQGSDDPQIDRPRESIG